MGDGVELTVDVECLSGRGLNMLSIDDTSLNEQCGIIKPKLDTEISERFSSGSFMT